MNSSAWRIPAIRNSFRISAVRLLCIFFHEYPSPVHLRGKTAEELAAELRPVSHNNCSVKRAEKILELVRSDGETCRDCQESRDIITRSLACDLEHYREQMEEVEAAIETMLPEFDCTLMTMPGIDTITAANILAEIGNIDRFPNAKNWRSPRESHPSIFLLQEKGKTCVQNRETGDYWLSFIFWQSRWCRYRPAERQGIQYSGNIS